MSDCGQIVDVLNGSSMALPEALPSTAGMRKMHIGTSSKISKSFYLFRVRDAAQSSMSKKSEINDSGVGGSRTLVLKLPI